MFLCNSICKRKITMQNILLFYNFKIFLLYPRRSLYFTLTRNYGGTSFYFIIVVKRFQKLNRSSWGVDFVIMSKDNICDDKMYTLNIYL